MTTTSHLSFVARDQANFCDAETRRTAKFMNGAQLDI